MKHIVPKSNKIEEILHFFESKRADMRREMGRKVKDNEFYGLLLEIVAHHYGRFGMKEKILWRLKNGK